MTENRMSENELNIKDTIGLIKALDKRMINYNAE